MRLAKSSQDTFQGDIVPFDLLHFLLKVSLSQLVKLLESLKVDFKEKNPQSFTTEISNIGI